VTVTWAEIKSVIFAVSVTYNDGASIGQPVTDKAAARAFEVCKVVCHNISDTVLISNVVLKAVLCYNNREEWGENYAAGIQDKKL
jgi:hypothetical protein